MRRWGLKSFTPLEKFSNGTSPIFLTGFTIHFSRIDDSMYQLRTSLVLPISLHEAFKFFENPRNLPEITPGWLEFRIVSTEAVKEVFEGAIFDFTIRWFGFRFKWQTKIVEYNPPTRFIDTQLVGPYKYWRHLHIFEKVSEGTLLTDEVTYRLPLSLLGRVLHRLIIRRQLEDIFCYRAVRISQWARGKLFN